MTVIRPAAAEDIPRLVLTTARAFADDPVLRWLFPEDDDYVTNSPAMLGYLSRRWQATDTQWCTDDGVAMAGWTPPDPPEIPEEVTGSFGDHPDWRWDRFAVLGPMMAEHRPEEPHWYLNMLATHPDWQRQGLGAALMSEVFRRADPVGVPCYLETETEANVAYYLRHGFQVRSEWDVPLDGPHMWGMIRAAEQTISPART